MKLRILLLSVMTVIMLSSCESEYQKQLNNAKSLVEQEMEIRSTLDLSIAPSPSVRQTLTELKNDIAFHAHLSGNEEVFFKELTGYKMELMSIDNFGQEVLLSKYP